MDKEYGTPVMNRSKSSEQLSIGKEGHTNETNFQSEMPQSRRFQMSNQLLVLGAGGDN